MTTPTYCITVLLWPHLLTALLSCLWPHLLTALLSCLWPHLLTALLSCLWPHLLTALLLLIQILDRKCNDANYVCLKTFQFKSLQKLIEMFLQLCPPSLVCVQLYIFWCHCCMLVGSKKVVSTGVVGIREREGSSCGIVGVVMCCFLLAAAPVCTL